MNVRRRRSKCLCWKSFWIIDCNKSSFPVLDRKTAIEYSWDDYGTLFAAYLEPRWISRKHRSFVKSELQKPYVESCPQRPSVKPYNESKSSNLKQLLGLGRRPHRFWPPEKHDLPGVWKPNTWLMILVSWSFGRSLRLFVGNKKNLQLARACKPSWQAVFILLNICKLIVRRLRVEVARHQCSVLLSKVFERDGFINYI